MYYLRRGNNNFIRKCQSGYLHLKVSLVQCLLVFKPEFLVIKVEHGTFIHAMVQYMYDVANQSRFFINDINIYLLNISDVHKKWYLVKQRSVILVFLDSFICCVAAFL